MPPSPETAAPGAPLWLPVTLALLGFAPTLLPLAAANMAHVLPGCTANELGASGCILMERDIGPLLSAPFALLPLAALALPFGFAGTLWALARWGRRRAATRRARHK